MAAFGWGLATYATPAGSAAPPSDGTAASDAADLEAFEASGRLHDPRETHLSEVRQLTFGGENAEAYWSPDGKMLSFQSTNPPFDCDQIFLMAADGTGRPQLVSTGEGRTTCAYYSLDGQRVLYSSTHEASAACPPTPDRSQGYVWPIYDSYEIYSTALDGSGTVKLTENDAYDAEATVCPVDGSIVFTSTRDGDLELYRMDADGGNVKRLTEVPGYDGGAFFSRDCSKIVWRASRFEEGEALEDYRRLLANGLIRPSHLEIWVANADGSEAHQVTFLGAASFAPYFYPSGDRILFSSNYGGSPREFDIWAVDVDGTDLERITYAPGFDGFPIFSPDGEWLAFGSNRNQGKPGETDVYVARWKDHPPKAGEPSAADRVASDIAWLAADERQGRGLTTEGLKKAQEWLAERFKEIGAEPAGENGSYFQSFEAPVSVEVLSGTSLSLASQTLPEEAFRPAAFSSSVEALRG
ncbi:MAG: PD40 domain-containing protein, partial [Acidobacteria bacterium]|nr:PD40 domain-containing protein [Acidobacteriota bacterium]